MDKNTEPNKKISKEVALGAAAILTWGAIGALGFLLLNNPKMLDYAEEAKCLIGTFIIITPGLAYVLLTSNSTSK